MTYIRGQHNVISDDSGQKFKSGEMRKTWDGKMVHVSEWEEKHPQFTIRPRADRQSVRNARPRATTPNYVNTATLPDDVLDNV